MVFTNTLRPFQERLTEPIYKGLALIWWGTEALRVPVALWFLCGVCVKVLEALHTGGCPGPWGAAWPVACGLRKREEHPQVGLWPRPNHGVYKGLSDSLNEVGPCEIAAFLVKKKQQFGMIQPNI